MPTGGAPRASRRRIAARRGVVLGLLVLCVLIFTSFFREGDGGYLHQLKGTVGAAVTPVQKVAVGAIQPLKDGWNWFADLRGARDRAARLQTENDLLRSQIIAQTNDRQVVDELRKQLKIARDRVNGYEPVTAQVISRPPDLSHRAEIDKGRSSGIVKNSLVFAPAQGDAQVFGALVGLVTETHKDSAVITFITDPSTAIGARLAGTATALGLLTSTASGELSLTDVPGAILVNEGDDVVTAGIGTPDLPSPYPQGLPIGRVTSVGRREPGQSQTVQVHPFGRPLDFTTFTVFVPKSAEAKRRAAGVRG